MVFQTPSSRSAASKRPAAVVVACSVLGVMILYMSIGALSPLFSGETPVGMSLSIASVFLIGLTAVVFTWRGFSWCRWLVAAWFFVLPVLGATLDSMQSNSSVAELLVKRVLLDWWSWVQLIAIVGLFLPPSSKWFKAVARATA